MWCLNIFFKHHNTLIKHIGLAFGGGIKRNKYMLVSDFHHQPWKNVLIQNVINVLFLLSFGCNLISYII